MKDPQEKYHALRLEELKNRLEKNNFEVYIAEDAATAGRLVIDKILPATGARTVSYGGSLTMEATGLLDQLTMSTELELIRPDGPDLSLEEKIELRRQGLLVDLYFSGTNSITEEGHLVNLDRTGNRVAAITFGPRHVVILAGRNKIVSDLEGAVLRIKEYAAPVNAIRLDCQTPCVKTGHCEDCNSPDRICNSWTITEKSFPKGRIKVVLINEELGF